MKTTRRRYLRGITGAGAVALAGLAGCTDATPDGTDDGGDGSPSPTFDADGNGTNGSGTRPAGTGGPGVTLSSVDGDVAMPVAPAVEIVREAATPAYPPRLRTTLRNESAERIRVGEGRAVHFEFVYDDSNALVLLPGEGDYPAEADCWRLTEGVATTEEYRTFDLAGGESSSRPVDLYATPGEDACLPVGEFRFETTLSIVSDGAEPRSSALWGFSVTLE